MVFSYVGTLFMALIIINIIVHTMFIKWSLVKRQELLMAYARNLQYIAAEDGLDKTENLKHEIENTAYESGAGVIIADKNRSVIGSSGSKTDWEKIKNNSAVSIAFNGRDSSGEYEDDGKVKFIYAAVPVSRGDDTIGIVLLSCMIDDVYSAADDTTKNLIVVSLVIMLLLGLIIYVLADRITRSLNRITKAIESMDKGSLRQQVTVTGRDEVARLGNAFNQMNSKVMLIDEQRRTFVANASHELKSPLAGIKVLVQTLINGALEDKKVAFDFLNDIDKETDRLSNTVTNLLELTKLEGEHCIKAETFDLGLLCNEVAAKLSFKAEQKRLDLKVDTIPVVIEANREQILRAVYNILENAIKYSRQETSIHLWIEEGENVMVHISDHGQGIPEDEIPKIFERFYRLDNARNRNAGGSGLGLPIAMEIVKSHGGDIKVESVVDEGSTFTIYLPYKQETKR
jgi:signal transduction histidine kinase